jgi:hypothetical protein
MKTDLLTSEEAAAALGISVLALYDWLSQSDGGEFQIRGQAYTIEYFQGGRRGQGRIRIEAQEIERLREAMRVRPQLRRERRVPSKVQRYPGITVPLGTPTNR